MMTTTSATASSALLHRIFWRLHFWAGVFSAPIVLFAALSGALYIFSPQIEAVRHANLDTSSSNGAIVSLDRQIAAVTTAFPHYAIKSIIPALQAGSTTQVFLVPHQNESHTHHQNTNPMSGNDHQHSAKSEVTVAYVDPITAKVQGDIAERDRFKHWARKLHSSMLQGDGWRWLIEFGASWMIVLMISGIYLWWPRSGQSWRSVLTLKSKADPSNARASWRYWHSILSICASLLTLSILLTGITWSKFAGENFRSMQSALHQNSPKPPKNLQSTVLSNTPPLTTQTVWKIASEHAPQLALQLTPPKESNGVWLVENVNRSEIQRRTQFAIDAYSGLIVYQSGWDQLPFLAKVTAIGIPFHRGEFGWWNQLLLLMVVLNVIFSVVSGYVMWWQRRKPGRVSAPQIRQEHRRAVPLWFWLIAVLLGIALPVLGVSLAILISLECVFAFTQRNQLETSI